MLKHSNKIIIAAIIGYFIVVYGQNFLEFGSEMRINFYFIGMSAVQMLFAYYVYLKYSSYVTTFWAFYCVGDFLNELMFLGDINFFELWIGTIGIVFNLLRDGRKRYKQRNK